MCKCLAGVPIRGVRISAFINGKVALEHAAFNAERFDARFEEGTKRRSECFRRRWLRLCLEAHAIDAHPEAAQFDLDIGAASELANGFRPAVEDILFPLGVRADLQGPADIIQHDPLPWYSACK